MTTISSSQPHPNVTPSPILEGHIKWFNETKGFGFITPDEGGGDVFIHRTTLDRFDVSVPRDGERIRYRAKNGIKGMQAFYVEEIAP